MQKKSPFYIFVKMKFSDLTNFLPTEVEESRYFWNALTKI